MPQLALLVDLDGVLRRWPAVDDSLEEEFGLPAGSIRTAAFDRTLIDRVITGRLSDDEWRQHVAAELQAHFPTAAALAAVKAWSEPCGEIDQGTLAVVRWARKRARVCLVTNATSRLNSDLDVLGIRREFDCIVNSSAIGSAKPEARIFELSLSLVGATASHAVFVDDQKINVQAAVALGINGHLFTSPEVLKEHLTETWGEGAA
jgi:putative hydrolase of the HAD superfamily